MRSVVVTVGSIPTSCKTDSAGLFYAGFNAAVFSRLSQLPTLPGSRYPPLRTKQTQRFSNIWRHAQVQNRLKVSAYKNVGTSNCDGLSKEQERSDCLSPGLSKAAYVIHGLSVEFANAMLRSPRRFVRPLEGRHWAGVAELGVKPLALR